MRKPRAERLGGDVESVGLLGAVDLAGRDRVRAGIGRGADPIGRARLGESRLDRIQDLAELLAESNLTPSGFVLVGVPHQGSNYYGYSAPASQVALSD